MRTPTPPTPPHHNFIFCLPSCPQLGLYHECFLPSALCLLVGDLLAIFRNQTQQIRKTPTAPVCSRDRPSHSIKFYRYVQASALSRPRTPFSRTPFSRWIICLCRKFSSLVLSPDGAGAQCFQPLAAVSGSRQTHQPSQEHQHQDSSGAPGHSCCACRQGRCRGAAGLQRSAKGQRVHCRSLRQRPAQPGW